MNSKILPPLAPNHPVILDDTRCTLCGERFVAGQRTALIPEFTPEQGVETVPALLIHAACLPRLRQIALNFGWIMGRMDLIHDALCPDKTGTWQIRVEQAVEAAEKLAKKS